MRLIPSQNAVLVILNSGFVKVLKIRGMVSTCKVDALDEILQLGLECQTKKMASIPFIKYLRVSMESRANDISQGTERVHRSCTEIIIVRHGETEWNALGKMQGQADIDLNNVGRQQALAVADRLSRELDITAVYSSDLKRALETAEMIAAKCHGLEVILDRDLRERHIGELQGLVFHDLPKINPEAYGALISHESDLIPGGGESRRELYRRCTSSLQRIGERHRGQRVVVVSHGAVIETLYKRALPEAKREGIANASIGIIKLSEGNIWDVKLWNDVSHLADTPFLKEPAFGEDNSSK